MGGQMPSASGVGNVTPQSVQDSVVQSQSSLALAPEVAPVAPGWGPIAIPY